MKYSLSFPEGLYADLMAHLFPIPFVEQAAFLLCKWSNSEQEKKLLVIEAILVKEDDIFEASTIHMKIKPQAFLRAMKRASDEKCSFVFIHSHPDGVDNFSLQDDREENKLFQTAYNRIHHSGIHASLVVTRDGLPRGRVWLSDLSTKPISKISVIGNNFRFRFHESQLSDLKIFDRQVRAFGEDAQHLIGQLCIGVIGVGGTGSSVLEQLTRLGVRKVVIADGDAFDRTNVNRVYGSTANDHGIPKVDIAERSVHSKSLGIVVEKYDSPVTYKSILEKFRKCDVIFACTDDEWGRSLLTRFSIYYHIPVIDMGVKIQSKDGEIRSIEGRVTTLFPDAACLFCRNRINSRNIHFESLSILDPDAAQRLIEDGYAPELVTTAPSVIPFTTGIASEAISEFLNRITQFMGDGRRTTEVLHFFDQNRVRTNSRESEPDCFCSDKKFFGRGDVDPFLDVTWRPENDS